jgi:hypothetical protein
MDGRVGTTGYITPYDIVFLVVGWEGFMGFGLVWNGMAWGVCVHGILALHITERLL